ncbi:unnamed protein product, partial [Didymodactylos carnosus]
KYIQVARCQIKGKTTTVSVKSVRATTHVHTVPPMINMDGHLVRPVYLCLKAPIGCIGEHALNLQCQEKRFEETDQLVNDREIDYDMLSKICVTIEFCLKTTLTH